MGAGPITQAPQDTLNNTIGSNYANNTAYQGANAVTNQGLGAQSALATALSNQNGVGTQSQAVNQQQGLANAYGALAGQNAQGLTNQSNIYNQYGQIASGQGPNPAMAALAQQTGQLNSQQAALAAGQRGAGSNVGLIERQAAQQGAANNQNAIGQAATLQAQQSLSALGQQAGIAGQQVGQQQSALAGQQGAISGLAGLSTQQIAQLQAQQQGLTANALTNQGQQLTGIGNQQTVQAGLQNTLQQGQNSVSTANAGLPGQIIGGALNGLGAVAGAALTPAAAAAAPAAAKLAFGGKVDKPQVPHLPPHLQSIHEIYHKYAEGGEVKKQQDSMTMSQLASMKPPEYNKDYQEKKIEPLYNNAPPATLAKGGNVGSKLKDGGKVPGQAKQSGDHLSNDTVAAKLSPGEVVLPKSVMESKDPVKASADFVAALMKKKGSGSEESDFKAALQRSIAGRKK